MPVNPMHPPGKPEMAKSDQASEIYGSEFIWIIVLLLFAGAHLFLNWS